MTNSQQNYCVEFLPDGRPCPMVLTSDEVISLLRLDGKHPERTLKYFRDAGMLHGVILGKKVRYRLQDIKTFLEWKTGAEKG